MYKKHTYKPFQVENGDVKITIPQMYDPTILLPIILLASSYAIVTYTHFFHQSSSHNFAF